MVLDRRYLPSVSVFSSNEGPAPLEDSGMYAWLTFGHLLGLALLAAGMGVETVASARLRRASTLAQLRTWQRLPVEKVTGVGLLLVVTGLAMAWQGWSFSDGWIVAALMLVVVFILAGGWCRRHGCGA